LRIERIGKCVREDEEQRNGKIEMSIEEGSSERNEK